MDPDGGIAPGNPVSKKGAIVLYKKKSPSWLKHADFLILDIIIVVIAFFLAFRIRHGLTGRHLFEMYKTGAFVIALSDLLGALIFENHKNILKRGYGKEFLSVIKMLIIDMIGLLFYFFFWKIGNRFSRSIMAYFFIIGTVAMFIERVIWKKALIYIRNWQPYQKRHMLLVTTNDAAEAVIDKIRKNSFGEIEIIGLVLDGGDVPLGTRINDIVVVATLSNVADYMQTLWIDEVMIYLPSGMPVPSDVIRVSEMMGITIHINLDCISETDCMRTIDKVGGIQVLTESIRLASGKQMFAKRVLDILGALVGLVFTGILTVIVGPMIYFSDPGPIFFSQSRVGMNGRKFKIYKFRSMYQDAEARKKDLMEKNEMQGLMFKIEADPRIIGSGPDGTKHGIGWFIRKTSIDEFPQFWNVLKGEMSLVGTRPPTADEWEQYEAHHRARMSIRPGLTGLWQVSGRSDITDFEEVIALDMQYINNWTIYEDIKIILKTVGLLFSGGGAK